jgi:hypothetical protein
MAWPLNHSQEQAGKQTGLSEMTGGQEGGPHDE